LNQIILISNPNQVKLSPPSLEVTKLGMAWHHGNQQNGIREGDNLTGGKKGILALTVIFFKFLTKESNCPNQ